MQRQGIMETCINKKRKGITKKQPSQLTLDLFIYFGLKEREGKEKDWKGSDILSLLWKIL